MNYGGIPYKQKGLQRRKKKVAKRTTRNNTSSSTSSSSSSEERELTTREKNVIAMISGEGLQIGQKSIMPSHIKDPNQKVLTTLKRGFRPPRTITGGQNTGYGKSNKTMATNTNMNNNAAKPKKKSGKSDRGNGDEETVELTDESKRLVLLRKNGSRFKSIP